jgi:hypothetical protein
MSKIRLCALFGAIMLVGLSNVASAGNTSTNSSTNTSTNTSSDWSASNSSSNSSSTGSSNGALEDWRAGWHCDEDEVIEDHRRDVREDARGGVGYVVVFEEGYMYECF